jgi:hypothetical protein
MPSLRRALLSLRSIAVAALFLIARPVGAATSPKLFDQIDGMLRDLSQITGWQVHRKVPAETIGNDRFRTILKTHVDKVDPKKIRAEELTLKMFGLVPDDFSLAKETVDLFSEQVAAYYDSDKKRLFVLDNVATDFDQRTALVHELAHALADQQHSLLKYLHSKGSDASSDDAATARQAVMEGQATWLTWAYVASRNGGKAEVPQATLDMLVKATSTGSAQMPVFASAPLYFRESLVFPYTEGLRFQDAIFRKLGQRAFEEVFNRPPESTQNILHPDSYLAKQTPAMVQVPALKELLGKDANRYHLLAEGDLGEFDFSVLLRQYTDEKEGAEAASHLRGAAFKLWEEKKLKSPMLEHVTVWDSYDSAKHFVELYQTVLKTKWKKMEIASSTASLLNGTGDSGKFEIHLSGATVQVLEGLK